MVTGERYITREPGAPPADRMAPDLLIAFNADPETYKNNNGYIVSIQGKHPDFVMEIASRSTGRQDVVEKRAAYAALEVPEYWRFDETGEFHGTRLAGDRLLDDQYEPVPIETVEEGGLQGYNRVLNLFIQWEHGELRWHDPETGQHIMTFKQERDRADAAEDRVRELEAELARRNRENSRTSQPKLLRKRGSGTTSPIITKPPEHQGPPSTTPVTCREPTALPCGIGNEAATLPPAEPVIPFRPAPFSTCGPGERPMGKTHRPSHSQQCPSPSATVHCTIRPGLHRSPRPVPQTPTVIMGCPCYNPRRMPYARMYNPSLRRTGRAYGH